MRLAAVGSRRRIERLGCACVAILGALALAGCGSSNPAKPNTPAPTSTTYTGAVTGVSISGKLTVTIATGTPAPNGAGDRARASVTAAGTFAPSAGAAVSLSGTWDGDAKTLHLTDGGGTWTFDGGLNAFGMEGFFTGPSAESGVFSLFSGSAAVTVIVGTYGPAPPYAGLGCTPQGRFNFAISGTEVHGNAYNTCGGQTIPLDGTYAANGAIAIVNPSNPTGPNLATGTLSGTAASGQWNDGTYAGVWSGTKQ